MRCYWKAVGVSIRVFKAYTNRFDSLYKNCIFDYGSTGTSHYQ